MRNSIYTTRRDNSASMNFSRNYGAIRHTSKNLGPVSQIIIVSLITLSFGLIYVAEGTKATGYDYDISAVEGEISEMQARKEDLAAEKARLTSVATAKNSSVAAVMENATVTGYAD